MALQDEIYQAAKDGKVEKLQALLISSTEKKKEEIKVLVNAKTNGTTPLLIACKNGHFPVVEFLLTQCCADLEHVGSVSFDGEKIDGAPPLWCAAAAGHLHIVKLLIQNGANVNNTTATNSTPLRAACFDGHFAIVKYLIECHCDIEIANRHGHTCLMIASYKGHYAIVQFLILKGANPNRSSLKGNTALHDCAESGSLDILKFLLENGAVIQEDSYGMTPLMASAVSGHTKVVEYFICQPKCRQIDRIHALELLGSTYIDKKRDMIGAMKFWKRAMSERDQKADVLNISTLTVQSSTQVCEETMVETSREYTAKSDQQQKSVSEKPKSAYDYAMEAHTFRELDNLMSNPDAMRMQALLKRERILGPAHPDTSYYIRYRGAVYADIGNYEKCIVLWKYALEMQQNNLEPLHLMTQSSFLSFAELFYFMDMKAKTRGGAGGGPGGTGGGEDIINMDDMVNIFAKAIQEIEVGLEFLSKESASGDKDKKKEEQNFNRLLVIVMHILSLMSKKLKICRDNLSENVQFELKKLVYYLVHLNAHGNDNFSPLHLACSKDTSTVGRYPVCTFPTVDVVSLLLEVGASPNAIDTYGNTPLHISMKNKPCNREIVTALLKAGAHLDAVNFERKTAADLLSDIAIYDIVCPVNYLSLQCLCAKKIKETGLMYKDSVSSKLENFVDIH